LLPAVPGPQSSAELVSVSGESVPVQVKPLDPAVQPVTVVSATQVVPETG
jgi:hypothetical protein